MPHNPHSSVASLESPALVTCPSFHSLLALHLCLFSIMGGSQLVFAPGGSKPTMAPASQWTFLFFTFWVSVWVRKRSFVTNLTRWSADPGFLSFLLGGGNPWVALLLLSSTPIPLLLLDDPSHPPSPGRTLPLPFPTDQHSFPVTITLLNRETSQIRMGHINNCLLSGRTPPLLTTGPYCYYPES